MRGGFDSIGLGGRGWWGVVVVVIGVTGCAAPVRSALDATGVDPCGTQACGEAGTLPVAAPWPRFHPLPVRPVFEPREKLAPGPTPLQTVPPALPPALPTALPTGAELIELPERRKVEATVYLERAAERDEAVHQSAGSTPGPLWRTRGRNE